METETNLKIDKELIAGFCIQHHIQRLSLFGSVTGEDFGPESDIDVLVEFEPGYVIGLFRFCAIEAQLSEILGRKVDMRTPADLSRYFREEVIEGAEVQYAQE